MQDPLFQLTPETPMNLNTLFPMGAGGEGADMANDVTVDEAEENSGTLDSEEAHKMDQVVEELHEQDEPQSTLEERIQKIEEEYNSSPIAISGSSKRLLTLARSLTRSQLHNEAKAILRVVNGE